MKSVSYRHKWLICSLACFFTAFLIAVSANTCKQEADASRIAPYVLRFHILAESNSKTDQQLKLKVREQVLSYIQETLSLSNELSYQDHFPARTYGNAFFPCGYYDAARITIGKGKGRNWWCVLYPGLCFTNSYHTDIDETASESYSLVFETAPRPELHLGLLDAAKQLFKQKA